jgi:sugar O-acyltransferase (sialic acid O-acetyltransferase NeuD family)
MNERLIIIGASGHGKVVADIAIILKQWKTIAFLDDNETIKTCMGYPVIGKTNDFSFYIQDSDFFVAIGNNKTRESITQDIEKANGNIVTLIHPSAIIGSFVEIGKGTAIMAGTVINPCSVIGKGCIVNTSSIVEHDNIICDFVHLSPGTHLAGSVKIGTRVWIGIGATVIQDVNIVNDVIIGSAALVIRNIDSAGVYVGIPAKKKVEIE